MSKPKSVDVLGQRITIEYTKDYPAEDVIGLFDGEHLNIKIHDTVYYDKTLIHEICHSILYISGLSNTLSSELEEAICTAFEHGFFGLYSRNF